MIANPKMNDTRVPFFSGELVIRIKGQLMCVMLDVSRLVQRSFGSIRKYQVYSLNWTKYGNLTDCATYHNSDLSTGRNCCFPSHFCPPGFQMDYHVPTKNGLGCDLAISITRHSSWLSFKSSRI